MYSMTLYYKDTGMTLKRLMPIAVCTDEEAIAYAENYHNIEASATVIEIIKNPFYNYGTVLKTFPYPEHQSVDVE